MQRKKRNSILLNKKAISPLIATVLIIGFTVSLTAVVMTWGKGFITEKTQETSESAETQMRCINLEFTADKACITGNNVQLTLRNMKSERIDGFRFRSKDLPEVLEELSALEPFTGKNIAKTLSRSVTTIDIVPLVKEGSKYTPCAMQTKTARLTPCA